MKVDKPTVAEYVECLAINRESFEGEERAPDGVFLNEWDNGNVFLYYGSTGQVTGFAIVTQRASIPYLWVMAVKKEFRGQGIGRSLLRDVWQTCMAHNQRRIELTVKTTNPAQKLYFDEGYRVVKFLRGYYLGGGDGLLMRRVI